MARMVVVMSLVLVFAGSGRALASSVEAEPEYGCVQFMLDCYALAWEMDGYWDKLAAAVACDLLFQRCVRLKIFGV